MQKSTLKLLGENLRLVPLSEASEDADFKSFMTAAKQDLKQVQYAVFFETEAVHEGINGNGLRFFANDLKKAKAPFLFVPVKFEHDGPIVGTVVNAKAELDEDGAAFIKVKGVLWSLEQPYFVGKTLESIASRPDTFGTSMECYYDAAHQCDYGIGDKKISYQKFMDIGGYSMMGADYKGQGTVWQRPNNLTFTGLALTETPADRNALINSISMADMGTLQKAFASIVSKPSISYAAENTNAIVCPYCGHEVGRVLSPLEQCLNDIDEEEDVMSQGMANKKVEDVEELDELLEDGDVEEVEEAEEEVEEVEEVKPVVKKKVVKKVSKDKKPVTTDKREALRVAKEAVRDGVLSKIEEIFESMAI